MSLGSKRKNIILILELGTNSRLDTSLCWRRTYHWVNFLQGETLPLVGEGHNTNFLQGKTLPKVAVGHAYCSLIFFKMLLYNTITDSWKKSVHGDGHYHFYVWEIFFRLLVPAVVEGVYCSAAYHLAWMNIRRYHFYWVTIIMYV